MLVVALAVLTLGFITSLIPFMYPDTIMNVLGVSLNLLLGELVAGWLPALKGTLVAAAQQGGEHALTLQGVLAIYGAPMMLILVALRNR